MGKGFRKFEDIVKRENWKGRHVWVVRDANKRLITFRLAKGSKLTKQSAIEIFKRNNTLDKDVKKLTTTLVNFRETTFISKSPGRLKEPKKGRYQYVVRGVFRGKVINASSQIIGSALTKTNKDAKERARESFWERVSQSAGDSYDADQGKTYESEISDYQEGWKVYSEL